MRRGEVLVARAARRKATTGPRPHARRCDRPCARCRGDARSRTAHHWLTEIEVGPQEGMPTTSFLIAENALSAEKIYLTQRITELGVAKMDAVCRALVTATACG